MQKGSAPVLILAIIVILALGSLLYFSNIKRLTQKTVPRSTEQNPPPKIDPNTSIPILRDYDTESMGRNLWLYNQDLSSATQITFNHEISTLFGKSPDNKKVLVSTINEVPSDNNRHEKISTVDIDTKNIIRFFPVYDENSGINSIVWLDNDRLIYSSARQIKIHTLSSGSEEILVNANESISDSTSIVFGLSPDRKWLVYYFAGNGLGDLPQQDLQIYSINLETKKQTPILSRGYLIALNNNFIIYSKTVDDKIQIRKIDFSGTKDELITTLPEGELINLTSDDSGENIIYQVRHYSPESSYAALDLYNLDTKTTQRIFKTDIGDGIRSPLFSPNGDSVLFAAAFDKNDPIKFSIVNLNLSTNKQNILTNDSEHSSSTVILY